VPAWLSNVLATLKDTELLGVSPLPQGLDRAVWLARFSDEPVPGSDAGAVTDGSIADASRDGSLEGRLEAKSDR